MDLPISVLEQLQSWGLTLVPDNTSTKAAEVIEVSHTICGGVDIVVNKFASFVGHPSCESQNMRKRGQGMMVGFTCDTKNEEQQTSLTNSIVCRRRRMLIRRQSGRKIEDYVSQSMLHGHCWTNIIMYFNHQYNHIIV